MWERVWAIEPVVVGFCGAREITGNRWRQSSRWD